MRSRARFRPLLVNTVVGFIGPEYLYDGKQIIRAGLEDHFCGKLLGLPMGCDVCYTNHAEADQDDMDTLLTLLGAAGVNFIMGVPGADDVMLELPEHVVPRRPCDAADVGLRPAPEFADWLKTRAMNERGLIRPDAAGAFPAADRPGLQTPDRPIRVGRRCAPRRRPASGCRAPARHLRPPRCSPFSSPTPGRATR